MTNPGRSSPLVPAEVDLRGFPFMPLEIQRLLDSDIFALSTGDEFKAAVALWGRSWLQVPAASLPDDDRVLAHLSGAGTRWKKLKGMALRGWVLCSDGRYYHPVVAEKALEAWKHRLAQRARAEKRWHPGGIPPADATARKSDTPAHPPASKTHAPAYATAMQGRGRGNRQAAAETVGKEKELSTGKPGNGAAAALIFPEKLSNADRGAVERLLVNNPEAQILLDELDGVMGTNGARNPAALLLTMLEQQEQGKFLPSHAHRVQAEREGVQVSLEVRRAKAEGAA